MSVVNREVEIALPGALLSRLADARRMSDALFDIVRPDSLYERPSRSDTGSSSISDTWKRLIGIC